MVLYPNKLPESERVCSGICTLVCNGKIYSETHKQKFEVREATFKIDKNLANDSKLTLTINKQPISDWFKEQFGKMQQSMKSKGFRL